MKPLISSGPGGGGWTWPAFGGNEGGPPSSDGGGGSSSWIARFSVEAVISGGGGRLSMLPSRNSLSCFS